MPATDSAASVPGRRIGPALRMRVKPSGLELPVAAVVGLPLAGMPLPWLDSRAQALSANAATYSGVAVKASPTGVVS